MPPFPPPSHQCMHNLHFLMLLSLLHSTQGFGGKCRQHASSCSTDEPLQKQVLAQANCPEQTLTAGSESVASGLSAPAPHVELYMYSSPAAKQAPVKGHSGLLLAPPESMCVSRTPPCKPCPQLSSTKGCRSPHHQHLHTS